MNKPTFKLADHDYKADFSGFVEENSLTNAEWAALTAMARRMKFEREEHDFVCMAANRSTSEEHNGVRTMAHRILLDLRKIEPR